MSNLDMASNENLEIIGLNNDYDNDSDQVDLRSLFYVFLRNKRLIGYFSLLGVLIGLFAAVFHKNLWSGNFQIVVNNKSQNPQNALLQAVNNSEAISSLIDIGGGDDELATQVVILKSPSVLMDIFNYVKKSKNLENYRFKKNG